MPYAVQYEPQAECIPTANASLSSAAKELRLGGVQAQRGLRGAVRVVPGSEGPQGGE
jgi:hypothetical protein